MNGHKEVLIPSSITNEYSGKTAAEVLLWLPQIATAVLFFLAAYPKLTASPLMVELFDRIGLGQWFRYLTGSLEALGGVLLLIPGLAGFGGLLLVTVMLCATLTHLTVLGGSPGHAMEYLALAGMVAWFRRRQVFR